MHYNDPGSCENALHSSHFLTWIYAPQSFHVRILSFKTWFKILRVSGFRKPGCTCIIGRRGVSTICLNCDIPETTDFSARIQDTSWIQERSTHHSRHSTVTKSKCRLYRRIGQDIYWCCNILWSIVSLLLL